MAEISRVSPIKSPLTVLIELMLVDNDGHPAGSEFLVDPAPTASSDLAANAPAIQEHVVPNDYQGSYSFMTGTLDVNAVTSTTEGRIGWNDNGEPCRESSLTVVPDQRVLVT